MEIAIPANKDKDNSHSANDDVKPPLFIGSGNTIYDQANLSDAKQYELELIQKNHELAMEGDSKVIDSLNMGGRNTLRKNTSELNIALNSK